jgi:hypothetical protein
MAAPKVRADGLIDLDTSDVDRWIGKPLGGARLVEPIHKNDLRRWARAWRTRTRSTSTRIMRSRAGSAGWWRRSRSACAPTRATARARDPGRDPRPAHDLRRRRVVVLRRPDRAGDVINHDRMLFDYKVAETKFSGPTMFSRGDTTYINQRGEVLCKQRSTSVRYLAENARKLGMFKDNVPRTWTDQEIEDLEKQKLEYYQSFLDLGHERRCS